MSLWYAIADLAVASLPQPRVIEERDPSSLLTDHHTAQQGMALEDPLAAAAQEEEDEMNDGEVPITPRALATIR